MAYDWEGIIFKWSSEFLLAQKSSSNVFVCTVRKTFFRVQVGVGNVSYQLIKEIVWGKKCRVESPVDTNGGNITIVGM